MTDNLAQMQVASQVEELVRTHVDSPTSIPLDAELIYDLAMDSLELVELSLTLEKQFGIKLPIADIRSCVTLEEVIQLVSRIIQEKHPEKVEHE